jgi:hypothetical protein
MLAIGTLFCALQFRNKPFLHSLQPTTFGQLAEALVRRCSLASYVLVEQ